MKIICVYHRIDLDGWMSGAIVKKWFIEKYKSDYYILNEDGSIDKTAPGISKNLLNFLGWHYGDPIPDLSEYDKVIMCDVSFDLEIMKVLLEGFSSNFIWIDQHKSAINALDEYLPKAYLFPKGLRDVNFAACELTWKYFFPNEEMPEIVRLLGRYDCFGHKGIREEKKVLEFQYGARQEITNYEEAYEALIFYTSEALVNLIHNNGKTIYKYLCSEAKQIYKKAFEIKFQESIETHNERIGSVKFRKFLAVNRERFNPINFGIDYHKDSYDGFACFWYADDKWNWSLYNDNGKVDCSQIAKQHGGGGHKGAAGFIQNELNLNF